MMTFARRTLGAAVFALTALTLPASAQTQAAGGDSGSGSLTGITFGGTAVDDATAQKRREIEQAYKKATQEIPAKAAAVNDPWANMRGPEEQKPAAKPAAKRKRQ